MRSVERLAGQEMAVEAARHPFQFVGCWELREWLDRRARDARELVEALEEIPEACISYHMHTCLLRHRDLPRPYPNDFAAWAAMELGSRPLAERLGAIDPLDFAEPEALRSELVGVIDDHLSGLRGLPRRTAGEPFEFVQSRLIEAPLGRKVRTLREFRAALAEVDASAIYYHAIDAVVRRRRRRHDFAAWLEDGLGRRELAARVTRPLPCVESLEGLRWRLVALCDAEMGR